MRKTLIAAVSTLALMTGAAFAQSTTGTTAGGSTGSGGTTTNSPAMQRTDSTAATSATGASSATLASAEKLLGKNVYGKNDEKIGEVDDIILDPASGQAKQLVLSSGGFLGIGDKKVAIDFNQAKWNDADNRLHVATLGRDDVKAMSEFKYDDRMTSLNRNRDAHKNDASTAPANQRSTTGTTNPAVPPSGTSQPKQ
ncbi:PRC-barrel domain-containing protein [Azospirillum sp.]|uniref:PRC-barrel domain-containing protein n=1 Tax=Azospirillum sp. TaxID=34012 RepID=UPI003D72F2CD